MNWLRFLDFLRLKSPPAAAGHIDAVKAETRRVQQSAAEVHDVIRDFVHGTNSEKQRDIARRGE
jgi:hypothetical protein